MDYPSIYITQGNKALPNNKCKSYENYFNDNNLWIKINKQYKDELVTFENSEKLILGHVSERFKDTFTINHKLCCFEHPPDIDLLLKLDWGFMFIYNKTLKSFRLFNGLHGIYPIYYFQQDNSIIISNNYDLLLDSIDKYSFALSA